MGPGWGGGAKGWPDGLLACLPAHLSFEAWPSLPCWSLWKVVAWLIFSGKEKLEVYPLLPQEALWQWPC